MWIDSDSCARYIFQALIQNRSNSILISFKFSIKFNPVILTVNLKWESGEIGMIRTSELKLFPLSGTIIGLFLKIGSVQSQEFPIEYPVFD